MTKNDQMALDMLRVLDADEIERLPWMPVSGCEGVYEKRLWRFDSFVQALLRFEPGGVAPGRPHLAAHHHMWVVSGEATIAGRRLTPGSYVHVPPGVHHRVEDVGPHGCVVLQMHRPHAPQEAEHRRRS
jgi:mannose-6-phosphate isomerase-like protein (cupin superfamily)